MYESSQQFYMFRYLALCQKLLFFLTLYQSISASKQHMYTDQTTVFPLFVMFTSNASCIFTISISFKLSTTSVKTATDNTTIREKYLFPWLIVVVWGTKTELGKKDRFPSLICSDKEHLVPCHLKLLATTFYFLKIPVQYLQGRNRIRSAIVISIKENL